MPVHSDCYGLPCTAVSPEAVAGLDGVIDAYVRFRRDAGDRLKATLQVDPDLPMAHVAKGYFFKLFGNDAMAHRARRTLADARDAVSKRGATDRERLHLAALGSWCGEDIDGAIDLWEQILLDHPLDVFALRLAHFSHFYSGAGGKMRDSTARVLPHWGPEHRHYGNLLGMHAFGLEESGDYRQAERFGRRAVEIDPEDAWSVHAVAHVMEMEGRHREGIEWIRSQEDRWSVVNNFRFHLHWHQALYHLERYEFNEVLRLYDEQIVSDLEADMYLEMVNCPALLWRLEMFGVDVGDRWEPLAELAQAHLDDHELIFVSLHYLMALIGDGRTEAAETMLSRLRTYASQPTTQGRIAAGFGLEIGQAMSALRAGNWDRVVDCLWPVRYEIHRMGGSHAQRDLFELMLIDALLKTDRNSLARALLAERTARTPNSAWSWRRFSEALAGTGDTARSAEAFARADTLLRTGT
ncbi:MAG: tetratricopeptide repeat protein [Alphaproteobacteria bacterium]|nr:tetratricopeptide repeat protein [Alphaproteobacteria bacterium]